MRYPVTLWLSELVGLVISRSLDPITDAVGNGIKNKHSKFKMERNSKFVLMFNFKHVADVKKRRGIGRPFSISVLCLRAFSLAFTNMILNELLGPASLRRDYCFVVDCEKCSFQTEMEKIVV